ncbi:MAG TPA: amidohydrolase family protein [Longimicrobiales bacterium]|nr:amidohydrolase family protein [Longimicrobiales bacterium]
MATGDSTLLLEDGYVLCLDDADTRGRLTVAVADGTIAGIGDRAALRRRFPGAERMRCAGRVVMPGLVNAHLHPDLQVLKGILEDRDLHDWHGAGRYNDAVAWLGTPAGVPIQRISIRASLAEALLNGTTCVATYGVTGNSETECEAALASLGMRGTITIRDAAFAPAHDGPAWDRSTPAMYRLHAEERLDEAELAAAAAAHRRGEHIVMHAAETQTRMQLVRAAFGTTTVRLLEQRGLLSPRTLLSHAVFVDDDELDILQRRGVSVVVSPAAEMKLGDGLPPVTGMVRRGINVALGTDAAVCNNGTDMFLEMRMLGLSQKLRYGAGVMPAEQILRMATRAGAAALGGSRRFGQLAEGLAADLILVDVMNPRMQPLVTTAEHSNLAPNLVYAATGSDVTDVMVNGRWRVRRRRLLMTDARALWRQLHAAARQLHARLSLTT